MNQVKLFARITALILVLSSLMVSCQIPFSIPDDPSYGDCPVKPATSFNDDYTFLDDKSKYVFILVDKSYEYKYTNDVLQYISEEILPYLYPGDKLTVAWIDLTETTDSIFVNRWVDIVDFPQFLPTPASPLLTPTLELNGPTTIQGEQMIENEKIEAANDVIRVQYNCDIGKWNDESNKIFAQWNESQNNKIKEFSDKAKSELRLLAPKDLESGKLLYESFFLASQMLGRAKENKQFTDYVLIIFSDMIDWRPSKPIEIDIDLSNVKVAVAIHSCKYAIDCKVISRWQSEFKGFQQFNTPDFTYKPMFFAQDDNIIRSLDIFLSSIP